MKSMLRTRGGLGALPRQTLACTHTRQLECILGVGSVNVVAVEQGRASIVMSYRRDVHMYRIRASTDTSLAGSAGLQARHAG